MSNLKHMPLTAAQADYTARILIHNGLTADGFGTAKETTHDH